MPEIDAHTQAVRVAGAELGMLITEFWKKHPDLTDLELARILAGQLDDLLRFAVRAQRRESAEEEETGD